MGCFISPHTKSFSTSSFCSALLDASLFPHLKEAHWCYPMFPSWSGSAFKDWYALKCKCQCVGFIDRKCQRTSFSAFRRRGIFLKLVDRCAQMWKMLRAISLLQIIFFFPHSSAACVQVCALNCTILLCVGSDGGDKLSETRQEERVIRMGSRDRFPHLCSLFICFLVKESLICVLGQS